MCDYIDKNLKNEPNEEMNSNNELNDIDSYPLYMNCDSIYNISNKDLFIYIPTNELDIELYSSLINSKLLKKENIKVSTEIKNLISWTDFFLLGKVCLFDDNYNKCNECQLYLPIDLDFYSNKTNKQLQQEDIKNETKKLIDKYNLCKECYSSDKIESDKKQNLNIVKISTGLDNVSDWIYIFTIKINYMDYGYESSYYLDYFCNLNKKSPHYKKFGLNSYVEMLGDEFEIIKETSLQEILDENYK